MPGKKILCESLILLLIAGITMVGIPPAYAQTTLSLDPLKITGIELGENFTVALNITNVATMKGVAFKLDYNTTILDATLVTSTSITDDATNKLPVDANLTFHWDGPPTINDTMGRVWVAFWGFTTYTGSGVLFTINFTATAAGNSTMHIYDTEVLDNFGEDILHDVNDGEINVIPEFPTMVLIAVLLTATLAATFLGKMFWSRKRLGPAIKLKGQ